MYKKAFKVVSELIGVSLVIPLNEYFKSFGIDRFICIFISIILSVLTISLFELIFLEIPLNFKWLRQMVLPMSKYEGAWIETVDFPERPYSIFWIEYDREQKKYNFWGNSYNNVGLKTANWHSNSLIPLGPFSFHYYGKGYINSGTSSIIVENWGYLLFNSNGVKNKTFTSGTGFFMNMGDYNISANTTFERIDKKLLEKYANKKELLTQDDIKCFILAYSQRDTTAKGTNVAHTRVPCHQTRPIPRDTDTPHAGIQSRA